MYCLRSRTVTDMTNGDVLDQIIEQFTEDVNRAISHAKFWVGVCNTNGSMRDVANAMVAVNKVITVVDDLIIVCRIGKKPVPEIALAAAHNAHNEYGELVSRLYRLASEAKTQ